MEGALVSPLHPAPNSGPRRTTWKRPTRRRRMSVLYPSCCIGPGEQGSATSTRARRRLARLCHPRGGRRVIAWACVMPAPGGLTAMCASRFPISCGQARSKVVRQSHGCQVRGTSTRQRGVWCEHPVALSTRGLREDELLAHCDGIMCACLFEWHTIFVDLTTHTTSPTQVQEGRFNI